MTVIEEMSTLAIPTRNDKIIEKKGSSRSIMELKLNLLMKLVEKIKGLPNVSVKNVPFLSRSGMIVNVPGPFSLHLPKEDEPNAPNVPPDEEDSDDGEDALEDDEDKPENNEDDDLDFPTTPLPSHLDREKFVVRNEFGHVRMQHLLEGLEHYSYEHSASTSPGHKNSSFGLDDIGGHCVLPKNAFDLCIAKGWGKPHSLSGRYHPIAGTIIPETTLMFYAPRTETELEIVWNIVYQSYESALSSFDHDHE